MFCMASSRAVHGSSLRQSRPQQHSKTRLVSTNSDKNIRERARNKGILLDCRRRQLPYANCRDDLDDDRIPPVIARRLDRLDCWNFNRNENSWNLGDPGSVPSASKMKKPAGRSPNSGVI